MAKKGKKKGAKDEGAGVLAVNRKARFQYHLLDRFECGIELLGTEVKALREGGGSFADAYVHVLNDQALLEGFHIRHYSHAGPLSNHEAVRTRKLLLKKREIARLELETQRKGLTLVPVKVYTRGRWIKLEVALAQGKQKHDKREATKEREAKRDMDRALKASRR